MGRLKTPINYEYPIEMFGAVANNTDIAPFIQSANDKAIADNRPGKILLPSGQYKMLSNVQIDVRNSLMGHGGESTILKTSSGAADHGIKLISTGLGTFSRFGGFKIIGSNILSEHGIELISNDKYFHLVFYDIQIQNFGGDGFRALSASAGKPQQALFMTKFENIRSLSNYGNGFTLEMGTSISFDNCYASDCYKSGFRIKDNAYGSIQNSASEECGIGWELINNANFDLKSVGSELTADRSLNYPGIVLVSVTNVACTYQGLYFTSFINAGGNGSTKRFFKFDGDIKTRVNGVILAGSTDPSNLDPDYTYEIINDADVEISNVQRYPLPQTITKLGVGEFSNISKSDLHGSDKNTHLWRMDEQINYAILSSDLTLDVNSVGVHHLAAINGVKKVILPIPTLTSPNIHGMRFKIKNVGAIDNIEICAGSAGGTIIGILAPAEWADYHWDVNYPKYIEWKAGNNTITSNAATYEYYEVMPTIGGTIITLPHTPLTNYLLVVARNGVEVKTSDYTLVGNTLTFVLPFGQTTNAQYSETIQVHYYY